MIQDDNILKEAVWIGLPHSELERCHILEGDLTGRFACFTHAFRLPEGSKGAGGPQFRCRLHISANARYRLWVNGRGVHSGPAKGNLYRYYYDTVDIAPFLKQGENLIAVQVLYQDVDAAVSSGEERAGIYAVINPGGGHRLLAAGGVLSEKGDILEDLTSGKADWRCRLDGSYYLKSPDPSVYFLGAIGETVLLSSQIKDWKTNVSASALWPAAVKKEDAVPSPSQKAVGFMEKFLLTPRDIPLLYEQEDLFERELTDTGILKEGRLVIAAGQCAEVILDAGYVKNTYPSIMVERGRGAAVEILYYEKHQGENLDRTVRDDISAPAYYGVHDRLILDGERFTFEPFWCRTFRFMKIKVQAKEQEVHLFLPKFVRTGYPILAETKLHSSADWVEPLFTMCERTLKSCMMETYMDSPHYEQMQYPMDSRLQILFNYVLSGDTGLVKKAVRDFHDSILPMGLMPGKAPTAYLQIISTFSLHYIFILWEYYEQTADAALLRQYRSDLDRILDYYDSRLDKEYGLVGWLGYWPFVDWQKEWNRQAGVPVAEGEGPSAVISLMYGYALLAAAKIMEATGRPAVAREYRCRQEKIRDAVEKYCWNGEEGLYKDGPLVSGYSMHAQNWAVLNGCKKGEEAASLMERAVSREGIVPISFSTSYEFFRACELCGRYDLTWPYLKQWIDLLALGCRTCPETPYDSRSDCHAWSALPMYELVRGIAGIRAGGPGWEKARIAPRMDFLQDLSGSVITPRGQIRFFYEKQEDTGRAENTGIAGDTWHYSLELPEGLPAEFVFPGGSSVMLEEGNKYQLSFDCDSIV